MLPVHIMVRIRRQTTKTSSPILQIAIAWLEAIARRQNQLLVRRTCLINNNSHLNSKIRMLMQTSRTIWVWIKWWRAITQVHNWFNPLNLHHLRLLLLIRMHVHIQWRRLSQCHLNRLWTALWLLIIRWTRPQPHLFLRQRQHQHQQPCRLRVRCSIRTALTIIQHRLSIQQCLLPQIWITFRAANRRLWFLWLERRKKAMILLKIELMVNRPSSTNNNNSLGLVDPFTITLNLRSILNPISFHIIRKMWILLPLLINVSIMTIRRAAWEITCPIVRVSNLLLIWPLRANNNSNHNKNLHLLTCCQLITTINNHLIRKFLIISTRHKQLTTFCPIWLTRLASEQPMIHLRRWLNIWTII